MKEKELINYLCSFIINGDEINGDRLELSIPEVKILLNYIDTLESNLQEADELTEKYFDEYMSLKSNRTGDKDVK